MTALGMFQRLSAQIGESEARTTARLDRIEAKVDRILRAAGLVVEPNGPEGESHARDAADDDTADDDTADDTSDAPGRA